MKNYLKFVRSLLKEQWEFASRFATILDDHILECAEMHAYTVKRAYLSNVDGEKRIILECENGEMFLIKGEVEQVNN